MQGGAEVSLGVEAFNKKYGTNHNLKNAFGKCVSGKSKGKKDDEDEENEDEKNEDSGAAAKRGKAERASIGRQCLRLRERDEPQPEERLREVRVREVEGQGLAAATRFRSAVQHPNPPPREVLGRVGPPRSELSTAIALIRRLAVVRTGA